MQFGRSVEADAPPRAFEVLVVDDHPLFCEALSMALENGLGLRRVVVEHSLGGALRRIGAGEEFDAVTLDLDLPDVSGVDGLSRLKLAAPQTPVVVVSGLRDDRIIALTLRAGAAGFVPKDTPSAELVAAMRRVLDGDLYTPPDYQPPAPGGGDATPADIAERLAELTPQQMRILRLVCEGKLNKQIAFELDIAETTVKAHITAILRKLGVQSRTQAVLAVRKTSYADIMRG